MNSYSGALWSGLFIATLLYMSVEIIKLPLKILRDWQRLNDGTHF